MLNFKGKYVLVTGGAGFIGSHLCDGLLKEPLEKLVAVDNLFLGKKANLIEANRHNNFIFQEIDVTNFELINNIIEKFNINVIFHLAVIPLEVSLEKPIWCFEQNIKMSENLCEIIRKSSKKIDLIHFSSSEVYGSAIYTPMDENHPLLSHTPYAASKAATDLLVYSYYETFGIDIVIVRPFNNYGPRQNEGSYAGVIPITIKRILNDENPMIYDDGKQTRDFIYVKDTVRGTIDLYKNEKTRGKIINLASGKQTSVETIIRSICHELKYSGKIENRERRPGDVRIHEGCIKKVKKYIDFKTKVNYEEGIKLTVEWYRKNL